MKENNPSFSSPATATVTRLPITRTSPLPQQPSVLLSTLVATSAANSFITPAITPTCIAPVTGGITNAVSTLTLQDNGNIQSFDDDDNEWELGVGNLIIDLDADLERNSTSPISGPRPNSGPHSTAMSAMEHQAIVDKGLKMKIKRKNVNRDGKHEIVKDKMAASDKDVKTCPTDNKGPKGRNAVHKKDKSKDTKTKLDNLTNNVSNGFSHLSSASCDVASCSSSSSTPIANMAAIHSTPVFTGVKKESDPYEFNAKVEDRISVPVKKIKVEKGATPPSSPPGKPVPFSVPDPQPPPPSGASLHGVGLGGATGAAVRCHASTETRDSGTLTDPECLGPCEPGTSVTLEGIVWQETENGVLVVNVTWRGKTYVGTLLDATRHDWAPPRFNSDSPTSELDSRTPKGRGKRGTRGSISTPVENVIETRKLRKGRRGGARNFQAPPSPAKSDITPVSSAKRKARPSELDLTVLDDSKTKRSRSNSRGTPTSAGPSLEPNASGYIECPEPNCSKKYKHINGLRYHQSHAHSASSSDDKSGDTSKSSESSESRPPTPSTPSGDNKVKRPNKTTSSLSSAAAMTKDVKKDAVLKTEPESVSTTSKDTVTVSTASIPAGATATASAPSKVDKDKVEKSKQKQPGVSRPVVPAAQVVLTTGPVVNSPLVPGAAALSPVSMTPVGLKPIQPKPTVLVEPSVVYPALAGLKEKKNKHKKKTKDREKERSKSPKGAKEDCDPKPVIPNQSEAELASTPGLVTDDIAENVHSPAYSDISDANESAPSLDTDLDKSKDTKPREIPTGNETVKEAAFGLYSYYGQPPYLIPTMANKGQSQHSPSSLPKPGAECAASSVEVKIEPKAPDPELHEQKEGREEKAGESSGQVNPPQSLYSPGQAAHLPVLTAYGYIDPAYHLHLVASDQRYRDQHEKFVEEQKRFRKEQHQTKSGQLKPSSSKDDKLPSPVITSDQNKNVSKTQSDADKKEKQTENRPIGKENERDVKPQETRVKSEPYDSLFERQQEDLKRYYMYQKQKLHEHEHRPESDQQKRHEEDRRALAGLEIKQEPKSVIEHRPETRTERPKDQAERSVIKEPAAPKPDLKRSATPQRDQREVQEKRARVSPAISPATSKSSSKPPTPTLIPPYSQYAVPPAFIQGPYGQPIPFEPHYRGVNPMAGPILGYPGPAAAYMHPAMRYHVSPVEKERQLMMSPGSRHSGLPEPPKALDLLQQHAHYYNSAQQHKIHELEKAGRPEANTPPGRPRTDSSPVPNVLSKPKDMTLHNARPMSPPPQRHVHTHHHTHLVGGYPIYDAYGVIMSPGQGPPTGLPSHPFPPK